MSIPIRGTAKGTPDLAYARAIQRGAQRPAFLHAYLTALYADAATQGINGDCLVAQWDLETDSGRSAYWQRDGNPAGLGAFDDGSNLGLTFTPEIAARAHVTHMARYLGIPNVQPSWIATDARWQAVADAGYVGTVTTIDDLGNGRWATDPQYAPKLRSRYLAYWGEPEPVKEPAMTDKITFGRVPHPEYQNHLYVSEKKIEGIGWDNLGKRKPKFIALHRMYGTLAGTLSYFTPPTAPHLTDYAIGVEAIDGKKGAGIIHKYNDPTGFRSGWASGRVSAPYGDGKAIVDNYGINAVNRDGVSIELSGYWDTPVDAYSWSEYVKLIAYWVDFMRIPYDSLPLNPHTGINTFIWHQEFTIGTGKVCPGSWLMNNTSRLYKDVAAYLKPFQTGQAGDGTGGGETPKPVPVPTPIYAKPAPVAVLVAVTDKEATAGISDGEGNHYTLVNDLVEATRDTPRLQSDEPNAPSTGPVIKAKERFPVTYLKVNARGEQWYVTDWWTFVPVAHTKRISDAKAAA